MIYALLDLLPKIVSGMRTSCREIIAAHDWSKNLVLLILQQMVLAVAFYDSYDLLLWAFPHIGRPKSFVGGQRSHFDLIAVVGIHS